MAEKLGAYRKKRDFEQTSEPAGGDAPADSGLRFVVQEHDATRLHWDLRLEHDGVLASWALPRGIPDHPDENRLAVHTEDHPLEYLEFEGEIPKGEYGAGTMEIFDRGTYECEKWRDKEVIAVFHGRAGAGQVRALPHPRGRLDDPPDGPAGRPFGGADAGPDRPDEGPHRAAARATTTRWGYEIKWDGIRAVAFCDVGHMTPPGPQLHATSRPATRRSAALGRALGRPPGRARRRGRGLRRARQAELRAPPGAHAPGLGLGGAAADEGHPGHLRGVRPALARRPLDLPAALRGAPLAARAARARRARAGGRPPTTAATAPALLEASRAQGLEGIVAKRLDCPYEPGRRSSGWIKVKNVFRQEFVIGGYTPGEGGRAGEHRRAGRRLLRATASSSTRARSARASPSRRSPCSSASSSRCGPTTSPFAGRQPPRGTHLRGAAPRGRGRVPRVDEERNAARPLVQGPAGRRRSARRRA